MKELIQKEAERMAREIGPQNILLADLAKACGFSPGHFYNFMSMSFKEFIKTLPATDKHKINKKRSQPIFRKRAILMVAVELSWAGCYSKLTREMVAISAEVSGPTVTRYFGTMGNLKHEVMQHAIKEEILEIIAQGIVAKDRLALKVPAKVRAKIAKLITG